MKNKSESFSFVLNLFIALVWFANGLFCKILNLVPRHQQIVGRILGEEHAAILTKIIGVLEVLMAVWVISRFHSRFATVIQIILIATMNIIEFILAPDLLLFGKMNIVIASFFIIILLLNEMLYHQRPSSATFSQ